MNDHLVSVAARTTVGVTTTSQPSEEDEIQPVILAKDSQGNFLCSPSQQLTAGQPGEPRLLDSEAKQKLTEVLTAIVTSHSYTTGSVSKEDTRHEKISEQDIIPTLLDHDQNKVVLEVLNKWTTSESEKKSTVFQNAVSEIIDSQRQPDFHTASKNNVVHTIPRASHAEYVEDLAQPLILDESYRERIKSSQPDSSLLKPKISDNEVFFDNMNDNASFNQYMNDNASFNTSSVETSPFNLAENQPKYVSERESMHTILLHNHNEGAMNIINTSVNSKTSNNATLNQLALTDSRTINKRENTNDNELCATWARIEQVKSSHNQADTDKNSPSCHQMLQSEVKQTITVPSIGTVETNQNNASKAVNTLEKHAGTPHMGDMDRTKLNKTEDVPDAVVTLEQSIHETSIDNTSEQVVLRSKTKKPNQFGAQINQPTQNSGLSSINNRRPWSVMDVSRPAKDSSRFSDTRKSFTIENKSLPPLRPLSALRPLSFSTSNLSSPTSVASGRPGSGIFSSSTFASRANKVDYPKSRQSDGSPFQVDVLKGILGIGIKVKVTSKGYAQITEIQSGGAVDKSGHVRVGDYILFVNATELTGQTDARVQQVLRLLPRGLTKLIISSAAPASNTEPRRELQERNAISWHHAQQLPRENQKSHFSANPAQPASLHESEPDVSQVKDRSAYQHHVSPALTSVAPTTSVTHAQNAGSVETAANIHQETINQSSSTSTAAHNLDHPKPVPWQASSIKENQGVYSENTHRRDLQDFNVPKAAKRQAADQKVNFRYSHHTDFESSRDIFEPQTEIKSNSAVLTKPKTDTLGPTDSIFTSDQVSSQDSSVLLSHQPILSSHDLDKKELEAMSSRINECLLEGTPVTKENLKNISPSEDRKSPPRSNSSTKSDESVDRDEPVHTKPQPKISASYERPQTVTRSSKPSTKIEKSGPYVSSTAKLFDIRETSGEATPEQTVTSKHISLGVKINPDKNINTSLKPIQDRWNNTDTALPLDSVAKPRALPPSTQSWSRSVSSVALRPSIITLEPSRRSSESADIQSKNLVTSTHLNSALSPRRTSFGSPTTLSSIYPTKLAPKVKNESPAKSPSGKNKPVEHSDFYKTGQSNLYKPEQSDIHKTGQSNFYKPEKSDINKSASATLPENTSRSQERKPSSYHGQEFVTHEHYRKCTASVQSTFSSFPSEKNEDVFGNSTKKFDELLMDSSSERTEVDTHGILPGAPLKCDRISVEQSLTSETSGFLQSKASEVKIVSPRKLKESTEMELENGVIDKQRIVKKIGDTKELKKGIVNIEPVREVIEVRETKVEVSQNVDAHSVEDLVPSERTDNNTLASNISEQLRKSQETLKNDIPDGIAVTNKTIDDTEKVCVQQSSDTEEYNNLLESLCNISQNAPDNHQLLLHDEHAQLEQVKDVIDSEDNNLTNNHTLTDISEGMTESLIYESITERSSREVNSNNEKDLEANDTEQGLFKDQPSQIVENVIMGIKNGPDILHHDDKSTVCDEPASPASSNDVPPPLPGAPPPRHIHSDVEQLDNTYDLIKENESSVVSKIFTETKVQVTEDNTSFTVLDQPTGSSSVKLKVNTNAREHNITDNFAVPKEVQAGNAGSTELLNSTGDSFYVNKVEKNEDNTSFTLLNQSTSSNSLQLKADTRTGECITADQFEDAEEDQAGKEGSTESLNSAGRSFHVSDNIRVHSPSPVDMLSEDSGMPADEDQEVATDDAISPPVELAENVFALDSQPNMLFPSEIKAGLLSSENELRQSSSSVITQETQSFIVDAEKNAEATLDVTSVQRDEKPRDASEEITENVTNDDLPPPLLPFSAPPSVNALNVSTKYSEDVVSSTVQISDFQPFSPEIDLLGDDFLPSEKQELMPMAPVIKTFTESRSEQTGKSVKENHTNTAWDDLVRSLDNNVQEKVVSEYPDNTSDTITSKRKWCLKSNQSKIPVLVGEPRVPIHADYTGEALVKSLPYNDLISIIDKANAVLDAASAPVSLALIIVHLHRDEESVHLGVDLKHEEGIRFLVSSIKKGSLIWEEGSAKVGDWLLAVDSLWCDHVNVMRFLSRLAKPKHDSLLVFGRDEKLSDVTEPESLKSTPTPKPRSSYKQQKGGQLTDEKPCVSLDRSLEFHEVHMTSALDALLANERHHKPSATDKEQGMQQPLLENAQVELMNAQKPSKVNISLLDQACPVSDQVPSLIKQAPPLLLEHEPLLPEQAPPLPDHVPLLPDQAPPLLDQALLFTGPSSQLTEQAHLLRYQVPSLQDVTVLHSEKTPLMQHENVPSSPKELATPVQKRPLKKPLQSEQAEPILVSNENAPVKPVPPRSSQLLNGEPVESKFRTASTRNETLKAASANTSESLIKGEPVNEAQVQQTLPAQNVAINSAGSSAELGPGVHKVVMIKGASGVGFCLEGGIGSPNGDLPITIKRIFKGGPAEKCGLLKVKDEILEVNGLKFSKMRHYEAWNHLKFLDDGEVHITIHRT